MKKAFIKTNPKTTGKDKVLVMIIKTIDVNGVKCFYHKSVGFRLRIDKIVKTKKYYALSHFETGLEIFPSFKNTFEEAEKEISKRLQDNLESLVYAFEKSESYETINQQ